MTLRHANDVLVTPCSARARRHGPGLARARRPLTSERGTGTATTGTGGRRADNTVAGSSVLKMYLPRARAGGEAGFWEEGWSRQAVADAVACCALHPLRDRLAGLLPREGLILDGGCGIGAWAIYYSRRGHRMLGVDFAAGALTALKAAAPAIAACAGRVDALPLADNAVDAYYSGGVIEHFEGGPQPALDEAYRVLRPGGLFLVVVPDLSPLRQALCPGSRRMLADGAQPVVGFRRLPAPAPDDAPAT